jgi:hypothetical protein
LKYLAIGALYILSSGRLPPDNWRSWLRVGVGIEGEVTQAENTQAFVGPVTFTHSGLCTVGVMEWVPGWQCCMRGELVSLGGR